MNTKALSLALLLSLVCMSASAERITLSQAKAIAASFVKTATTPNLVKRKAAAATTSDDEAQPIYVFSRGEGQGFVIVSGDDALPTVIGYTESGDFDEDNLPPALEDMIEYYSSAAEALQTSGIATASSPRKATGTKDIATLMTSHWHQSWPYNNLCPYITGTTNRAATGCVATATSQIIYYWRKDLADRTKYDTPTYTYGDAPATADDVIPSGTPLKWDLMQDSYSGSDPEECTNAVATLVACEGMSGWLTYGNSTSGQISDQINVLSSQFGLNGGTCVWKSSYSQSSWETLIIKDLEEGRPILYSGVNSSAGGHAVVIDGYQVSTNLFHFNFGWGSGNGYDGYYTVDDETGMNGFNDGQGMVYQIYAKTPNVSGTVSTERDYFVARVANTITAQVTNNGTLAQTGFSIYCLTGYNRPSSSSSATDTDTETVVEPGSTAQLSFTFTPGSAQTYTVYLTDANKNILAEIDNVEAKESVADLTLNSLSVDGSGESETLTLTDGTTVNVEHIYNSQKANVTANFTNSNEGTLCSPSVQGIVYAYGDGEFTQSKSKTKKDVTFEAGTTDDMVFDFTGLTDDLIYKFELAGTAMTNKIYDINYGTSETAIYFRLVGSDMTSTLSEDASTMTLTGHYNANVFSSLSADASVSCYDLTGVTGLAAPLEAANKNALFYVDASQQVSGTNVITDMVCENLDLTPGYNFQPREDFRALKATYHATQAEGAFSTAFLPFDAVTPTGLFARKVNKLTGAIIMDVDSCNLEMKGGTPYIILSGEPIDITAENVDVSTSTPSLGTDTLRGTWVNLVGESTQYAVDQSTGYFESSTGQTIPALTAYMEYTTRVRITSAHYQAKDGTATTLAQEIQSALATYETYEGVTSASAQAAFMAAIDEARDSLRTQPIRSELTAQVNALEAAAETYMQSAAAQADNGLVDKTAYIANPSFELGSTKNWTTKSASVSNINSSLANYMSGADGTYVVRITAGGTVEQTLTGVENGVYQLVASLGADYGNHITLYADSDSITVEATDFGPMYLEDAVLDSISVEDNTLTIGVATVEDWVKADNFRLYQISGETTPVISLPADQAATPRKGIYDLSGRKLTSLPARGIYIVDGKKVIR